jgi:hypothetical protein
MTDAATMPTYRDLMNAMAVDLPETDHDGLTIRRFTVEPNSIENALLAFREPGRQARPGTYTRLDKHGRLWMSDTTAEREDHMPALRQAVRVGARRILVNGLGLGMVVKAALTIPTVEHVDVVEVDPRVAALVGPHYEASGRVTVHVADAYEQAKRWPRGTRWDVGWSDIWPDLCADYLPDMARLNRSYGRRCGWHECWGQDLIRAHERRHGW